jgi:hypothetical protein
MLTDGSGSKWPALQGVKTKIRAMGKMALLKRNTMSELAADATTDSEPSVESGAE